MCVVDEHVGLDGVERLGHGRVAVGGGARHAADEFEVV
jgi:hypothetical protein